MTVQLGYTIVYVPDVEASLAFYERAFGLRRRFITPEGDYGELETGPTTLSFVAEALADANLEAAGGYTRLDAEGPPTGVSVTLVTDDVAEAATAAVSAGARPYVDPVEKPWGQTVAYVVDPAGLLVEIATPIG